jgi:D-alanyl-D-alanine dipeptidase
LALALFLSAGPVPALVDVASLIPDAVVELRYAGRRNVLGRPIYPLGARCLLLPTAAKRLAAAAAALRSRGFRLLLWDCYRPPSAQRALWRHLPDPRWVRDPKKGSNHTRGVAVDVSLADLAGRPVEMPTDHDSFSARARPTARRGIPPLALAHRRALRRAMEGAGFKRNRGEWWHFDLPGAWRLPLLDRPLAPAKRP